MKELSRRSFIAGAGFLGAGVAALSSASLLTACSPQEAPNSAGGVAEGSGAGSAGASKIAPGYGNPDGIGIPVEPDSVEEADVVVVGSGMGGFAAAMLSKEQSPESTVIMLEKNSGLGGNTNFAEGGGGFSNSNPQAARMGSLSECKSRNYVVDPQLFYYKGLDQGDCADWLFAKHKVPLAFYGSPQPLYKDGRGATAIEALTPQAEELGVDIRTNSRAFALVLSDDYTVTGLQYKDETGKVVQINAKAVVLASGGINNNPELLQLYANQDVEKIIPLGIGQDGDGHLMVEQTAHGRSLLQTIDGFFCGMGTNSEPGDFNSDLNTAVGFQFTDVFVNQCGERFYDESMTFVGGMAITAISQMILAQAQSFSLFDESYIQRWEAGEWQNGKNGYDTATKVPRSDYPLNVRSELDKFSSKSWFYQADTLEALGQAIAADVETFVVEDFMKTIDAYNAAAEGAPDEFGKPQEFIWPLKTGPFYAVKAGVNAYNTNGGIRINRYAQVTDPKGKPIEGLYASGIATAGWDSQTYGGGTNQPVALWCSCAAARHLVENRLGGTLDQNWMGSEHVVDMYEEFKGANANGNPLGD
jgi:fumarate reductase flavoprotein subunit